ncbi:hypothetical protein BU14_0352s0026 [Porphyra umbilicalis]|uniref:riboflavin kinase n=1 Tax=Porphyra umbilicalis TaxID=2786 RepID=A0A1X6NXV3_PORUM|nr:hypothetical protein BU14_0352s0026 [Porphyra umbilicalis]|eukprot:OSX73407.1 hypothetical protein BU14_0352s0026 [Porphyra umbilicalis]
MPSIVPAVRRHLSSVAAFLPAAPPARPVGRVAAAAAYRRAARGPPLGGAPCRPLPPPPTARCPPTPPATSWRAPPPPPPLPPPPPIASSSLDTLAVLADPLRLAGAVATGFGRGSRQLGTPTANLAPSAAAGPAVAAAPDGVYVGWARIPSRAGGAVLPAVVNVGYNTTYGDVVERVVEAHVLSPVGDDFYGEELRLVLAAFLRPEAKFGGVAPLVAAIAVDCAVARAACGVGEGGEGGGSPPCSPPRSTRSWWRGRCDRPGRGGGRGGGGAGGGLGGIWHDAGGSLCEGKRDCTAQSV